MCLGRCRKVWVILSSRCRDCEHCFPMFKELTYLIQKNCRCDENTSTLMYLIDQSKVKVELDVDSGMLMDG